MKIKFTQECLLCVISQIYDDPQEIYEEFHKDESYEGELLEEIEEEINFQFGDGSCVYGLPKKFIEILEE